MADSLVWVSGAKRTVVSRPFISERTRAEFTYYLSQFTEIIDTGPYPEHETTRHYRFLSLVSNITLPVEKTSIFWDANTPFFLENPTLLSIRVAMSMVGDGQSKNILSYLKHWFPADTGSLLLD